MATTVVKTIGNGTRDYTSIQAWEDAAPANLVTSDQVWEGQLYPEGAGTNGEWTISAYINISGSVSDATRFKRLRCAAGMSFSDNASATTNVLRYNPANGVAIRQTNGYGGYAISATEAFSEIVGIQLTTAPAVQVVLPGDTVTVKNCLVVHNGGGATIGSSAANSKVINSALISTGTQVSVVSSNTPISLTGCTIIRPSGTSALCTASYGGAVLLKDCAVFGFTNATGVSASSSYNATDLASFPGSNNQLSLTASSQFENTTFATLDLRAKAGNGLQFGITDALIATDIIGQTRAATPTIGAWEVVSGGSTNGTGTGAPSAVSITVPTATATGTSGATNGTGTGAPSSISLIAPTATATGTSGATNGTGTGAPSAVSITVPTATGTGTTAGSGTITTPALKNNTGSLLASISGWGCNVFNATTGVLVVQKTGLTTSAGGVLTITDPTIVAGTNYAYEPFHATYGRRLPTSAAA